MTAPVNASLAGVTIGGREYPEISKPRCKTCQSKYRWLIEVHLVSGRQPQAIVDDLPEDAGLTSRNLTDHLRNEHLPLTAEAVVRLREQNYETATGVINVGAESIATAVRFAMLLVARCSQGVVEGEMTPTLSEGLRGAALVTSVIPDDTGDEIEIGPLAVFTFVRRYLAAAETVLSKEQFDQLARTVAKDRELMEIDERLAKRYGSQLRS